MAEEKTSYVGADQHAPRPKSQKKAIPQSELLSLLNKDTNSIKGPAHTVGGYAEISYRVVPLADNGLWRLSVQCRSLDTRTGLSKSHNVLTLDFETSPNAPRSVERISVLGQDRDVTDQNIFRAFMAASVVISRIDAGTCPDVRKILRIYGLRKDRG